MLACTVSTYIYIYIQTDMHMAHKPQSCQAAAVAGTAPPRPQPQEGCQAAAMADTALQAAAMEGAAGRAPSRSHGGRRTKCLLGRSRQAAAVAPSRDGKTNRACRMTVRMHIYIYIYICMYIIYSLCWHRYITSVYKSKTFSGASLGGMAPIRASTAAPPMICSGVHARARQTTTDARKRQT